MTVGPRQALIYLLAWDGGVLVRKVSQNRFQLLRRLSERPNLVVKQCQAVQRLFLNLVLEAETDNANELLFCSLRFVRLLKSYT